MALNIYHEARSDNLAGKFAVGDVVLNRVNDTRYPNNVCDVIYQGEHRPSWKDPKTLVPVRNRCQFSWYCDGKSDEIPLYDIADANALTMEELLDEMYVIVNAGTRLDINYYIEENVDEYSNEDITDYFMEAESDDLKTAADALADDDITLEEIQLVRIAFLSSMAN